MNTKRPTPPSPAAFAEIFDAIVRVAVREDMAKVYGEERRSEPREAAPVRELLPIFSRRQAE